VPALRRVPDQKHQFDLLQGCKQLAVPGGRALPPWRQVASVCIVSWKAKAHRHDGNARCIIKDIGRQTRPRPQAVAGRVRERPPRRVCAEASRAVGETCNTGRGSCGKGRPEGCSRQIRQARMVFSSVFKPWDMRIGPPLFAPLAQMDVTSLLSHHLRASDALNPESIPLGWR
jgi:hypothetical protein